MRRTSAPGGDPPPAQYRSAAEEIARRHLAAHPDEVERFGEHTYAWCVHDNQYILAWAADPYVDFDKEIRWLAGLLAARGYPLGSLADDLEIAAEVVPEFGARLREVAAVVRDLAEG